MATWPGWFSPYGAPSQPAFLPSLFGPVTVVTPPSGQLLTLAQAKRQCRVNESDCFDDAWFTDGIDEVTDWCARQIYGGVTLLTTTYSVPVRSWWGYGVELKLPYPPLRAVTSITYLDYAGTQQTLDGSYYEVLTPAKLPGSIRRAPNKIMPAFQTLEKWPVTVIWTAGFGTAADVPKVIIRAAKLLLADAWRNRDEAAAASQSAIEAANRLLDLAGTGSY